ncbi:MAG: hypothetical protein ACOC57_02855 [Acidobacteriota bacterium]
MASEKNKKEIPFFIALSYLISFLVIRLMVFIAGAAETEFAKAAEMGLTPDVKFSIGRNIILFGYHIHHFYIGILLICIARWLSIVGTTLFSKKQIAVIYGAGLGLFMDEIGLLLTWGNYYSSLSYLLSIFLAGLFFNILFFHHFWKDLKERIISGESHSIIWNAVAKNTKLMKLTDEISSMTGKTEKTSLFLNGIISIVVCLLILVFPRFLSYSISGLFILQGVNHLVRAWVGNEAD